MIGGCSGNDGSDAAYPSYTPLMPSMISMFKDRSPLVAELALISIFACSGTSRSARAIERDDRLGEKLEATARVEVAGGFTGAVLVARSRDVLLDRAYGSEQRVPMRTSSRFWIASAGKQFTSAAILKCQEAGRLDLNDPIVKFFPDAPGDKQALTIRQLLSHTSGLNQSYVSESASNRAEAVRKILAEPLIDLPGAHLHYSNNNYQLGVAIVEVAMAQDYAAFVTRELLSPCGMRDTGFAGDEGARLVVPARAPIPERLRKGGWGGQGFYSTTHELLTWYRALRSGRVLSGESVAQLFTPIATIQEGHAALGWFVGKTDMGALRIFTRGNEDFGPNSLLYAYPEGDTVIVVLSHAGDAGETASWSRHMHGALERVLFSE